MSDTTTERHPRGKREVGSCMFLECPNDATTERRVTRGSGLQGRIMVTVCDQHAKALDDGMSVLVEYWKG